MTEEEKSEVLARMVSNAIIAEDALRSFGATIHDEGEATVVDNFRKVAYIIGGKDAETKAYDAYIRAVEILHA